MDILDHLDHLRHYDDLLDDLLQDVRNLHDSLDGGVDGYDPLLVAIYDLSLGLDVILDVFLDDQLLFLNYLVLVCYHFLDLGVPTLHSDDLLLEGMDLLDLLMDDRDLDGLLPDGFDDLVDVDDDWDLDW